MIEVKLIVKLILDTGFVGATHEKWIEIDISKEEWEAKDEFQKQYFLEVEIRDFKDECVYVDIEG